MLEEVFDMLFSTKTGYEELDKRTALTKQKKEELLLVLRSPKIPLHHNTAELALRELLVKRKISNGTRSEDGRTACMGNDDDTAGHLQKVGRFFLRLYQGCLLRELFHDKIGTSYIPESSLNSTF